MIQLKRVLMVGAQTTTTTFTTATTTLPTTTTTAPQFSLVEKARECKGAEKHLGRVATVAECAAKTSAFGAKFFIYGTNEFGTSRCNGQGCQCYAEVPGSLTCRTTHHRGYNLYKNTSPGWLPEGDRTRRNKYCMNRACSGGRCSESFNTSSLEVCAARVSANPKCGTDFNYGRNDGWCDCVPAGKSCHPASFNNYDTYSVAKVPHRTARSVSGSRDTWCSHNGAIHQNVPGCGRVCSDSRGNRGVKNQGTWGTNVPCSACPGAEWAGCH